MSDFKVKFRGTRGSYPTPKADFLAFGGNTSCVEVRVGGHIIVLDCGYGIIDLGRDLCMTNEPISLTVLLSHTHMDHIQGLPFFKPLHIPTTQINLYGLCLENENLKDVLSHALFDKTFPLSLDDVSSKLKINDYSDNNVIVLTKNKETFVFDKNNIKIGSDDVSISSYKTLSHPKVGSLCIKIQYKGKTLVYATDIENSLDDDNFIEFAKGADLLIHDAQYTDLEYNCSDVSKKGYGHSTFEMAIESYKKTNAKELMFFHYDPNYDDKILSSLENKYMKLSSNYKFAKENLEVVL